MESVVKGLRDNAEKISIKLIYNNQRINDEGFDENTRILSETETL
jgi:hypothetical protein